jgi:hypothetical protein
MSRAGIGVQVVRRYGSRRIGYRAMYVRIGNLVVQCITKHLSAKANLAGAQGFSYLV